MQPQQPLEVIQQRASLYQKIRDYFHLEGVLEVEVPLLGRSSALDPHLASMSLQSQGQTYYLQTSPELFMKRLLCHGSGSIFAITKSFRDGEVSPRHNPEFSLLEWYRVGFSLAELMRDVANLLETLLPDVQFRTLSYAELFQQYLEVNPHQCDDEELQQLVYRKTSYQGVLDRPSCLDLLMTEAIEPAMKEMAVFVVDYPACQASMARVECDEQGNRVAKRFELYVQGVELANGYDELCDPVEQRKRLVRDADIRRSKGLAEIPVDERFLSALSTGLPRCSGVALGLDRLLWFLSQAHRLQDGPMDIHSQLLFPWQEM